MTTGLPSSPDDISSDVQAVLNVIAFLIAATTMWYAYFVKGKGKANDPNSFTERKQALTQEDVKNIAGHLASIANSMEKLASTLDELHAIAKHNSDEAEIERRVAAKLAVSSRRKPRDTS